MHSAGVLYRRVSEERALLRSACLRSSRLWLSSMRGNCMTSARNKSKTCLTCWSTWSLCKHHEEIWLLLIKSLKISHVLGLRLWFLSTWHCVTALGTIRNSQLVSKFYIHILKHTHGCCKPNKAKLSPRNVVTTSHPWIAGCEGCMTRTTKKPTPSQGW